MDVLLDNKQSLNSWLQDFSQTANCERILMLSGPSKTGPFRVMDCFPELDQCTSDLMPAGLACIAAGKMLLHPVGNASPDRASNRLLAIPLCNNEGFTGVIVVELANRSKQARDTFLKSLKGELPKIRSFLSKKPRIIAENVSSLSPPKISPEFSSDQLIAVCLEHNSLKASATALVSYLAVRFRCNRVSLGLRHGNAIQIEALSHSSSFDQRSNLLRNVNAAMDEALQQNKTINYPVDCSTSLCMTDAHKRLSRGAGKENILTFPLCDNKRIIGALCLERPETDIFTAETVRFLESMAILLGPLLSLKQQAERPLSAVLGSKFSVVKEQLIDKGYYGYKLKFAACLFALLFLAFANGEHRVGADAVLEGDIQRLVISPMEGYLAEINVRPGDKVNSGDILARLDDKDLRLEQLKWLGQHQQVKSEYREALAEHNKSQVSIFTARLKQADAQLELVAEQLRRTELRAPFDGIVLSGDWSQMLGSPVKTGDMIFKIAPLTQYRVILNVDEQDISYIKNLQQGSVTLNSLPDQTFAFAVEKITPVSVAAEGRNFFRIECSLQAQSDQLQPGMTGIAKVAIGERWLVWIWTHKMFDWLQLQLWG